MMNDETQEISKVQRKLKLWANKQNQVNSIILTTLLTLQSQGYENVTVKDLKNAVELIDTTIDFEGNYSQMKNYGEKNHGKVFEEINGYVCIWDKVKELVKEYELKVFKKKTP